MTDPTICPVCGKPGKVRFRFLKQYKDGSVHVRTVMHCKVGTHAVTGFTGRLLIVPHAIWLVPLKRQE